MFVLRWWLGFVVVLGFDWCWVWVFSLCLGCLLWCLLGVFGVCLVGVFGFDFGLDWMFGFGV